MLNKDQILLEEAYSKVYIKEDSDVGGNHWGPVGNYNFWVMDVIKAADATIKPINVPVEQFDPPTNLRTPANVEKYKQSMLSGKWNWDKPVYASYWKEKDKYYSFDGNHRVAAAIEANKEKPGFVKTIPTMDVDGIINQTIDNFKQGKKTIIGGTKIKIKAKE